MADPNRPNTEGAPPSHVHIEKKATNWLAWIALALGLLALLFALSRCNRDDHVATTTAAENSTEIVATTPDASRSAVLTGTSGLGGHLAGTEPARVVPDVSVEVDLVVVPDGVGLEEAAERG